MQTIKGTRICRECRGICHENSWRSKFGQRKRYWCCEEHLRDYLDYLAPYNGDSGWQEYRDKFFEPVVVVTQ
jgi:hypothetical protein